MSYGGMQLIPGYRNRLAPKFLKWYQKEFTNSRMGYGHWTAGYRSQNFDDYNLVVVANPGGAVVRVNTPTNQDSPRGHTFARNRNAWSISFAGMYGAHTGNLGANVPTASQVKLFLEYSAMACINNRQPVANLMTHHEAADNLDQGPGPPYRTPGVSGPDGDAYGPMTTCLRWDIWVWIDPASLSWQAPKKPCPQGWLAFPDWWRGETALLIQEKTRNVWQS